MRHNDIKFLVTLLGNRVSEVLNDVSDLTPPSVPGTPVLDSKNDVSATFHWTAATDTESAISRYVVWANNVAYMTLAGTSTTIDGLTPSTPYDVQVSAFDVAGNEGPRSGTLTFTTDAGIVADLTSPSVPTGLVASNRSTSGFDLDWGDSTDNVAMQDYIVYLNGAQFSTTTVSNATFSGLQQGTVYTVSVAARDTSGNTSAASSTLDVATTTPSYPAPLADTSGATNTAQTGATLNGQVNGRGVAGGTWWFEHGTSPTLTTSTSTTPQTLPTSPNTALVNQQITGYTHDQTIYFRVVASTAGGTARGDIVSFRCLTICNTSQTGPIVSGLTATSTGTVSVQVSATVNLNGHSCTGVAEVSTNSSFSTIAGSTTKTFAAGCGDQTRSFTINGLTASTAYYYRIRMTDDEAIVATSSSTITVMTDAVTNPTAAPTVSSVSVNPDLLSAVASLTVDANNSPTTAQVRYRLVSAPAWTTTAFIDCGQSDTAQVFTVDITPLMASTIYEYQYKADNLYNGGSTTGWLPGTPATFTTDDPATSVDDPDNDSFHPGPYATWWGKFGGKSKYGPEGFEARAAYAAVVTGDIVVGPRVGLWQVQKGYPVTYIKIRGNFGRDDHTVPASCRDFVTLTGDSTPRPRLKNCDHRGSFYGSNHGISDGTFTNSASPVPNGGLGAITNTQVDSLAPGEDHPSAESLVYLFKMATKNHRLTNKNYDVTAPLRTASALGIDPTSGQISLQYCDYDLDQFVQVHAAAGKASVANNPQQYDRLNFWFKLTPSAMPSDLTTTFKIQLNWTNYVNQAKTATTAAIPFNSTPAEVANAVGDAMRTADTTHIVRGATVDAAAFPNLDPALRHDGSTVCGTGYHNRRSTDAASWSTGVDQNYAEWQSSWGAKWAINFTAYDRALNDSLAPNAGPHASATKGVRIDNIVITQNNTGVNLTFHTNTQDANAISNYGLGEALSLTKSIGVLKNFHVDNYYGDGFKVSTLMDKSGNNSPTAGLGTFEIRYGTFALNPDRILRCANQGNHIDGIQCMGGVDQSLGNREGTAKPPMLHAVFFSAQGGSCVFWGGKDRWWVNNGDGTPFLGPGIVTRCLFSGRNKGLYITGAEEVGAKGCWFNVGEDRFGPGGGVIVPAMINPSYRGSLTNATARQDHVDDIVWPDTTASTAIQNYWSSNQSIRSRAQFPQILGGGAMNTANLIGTNDRGYVSSSLSLP